MTEFEAVRVIIEATREESTCKKDDRGRDILVKAVR
jgi:hypothetical protein